MILEYKGKRPKIGENVFIAWNATVIGDVEIGDNSTIWYGAVVRGDMAPIRIGANVSVQDNCTVHTDHDHGVQIADNVTIGHNAVIHGCSLESHTLIGISATVLNGALVRRGSIVAAGSMVRERQEVGPFKLVAGVPAVEKRDLPEEILQTIQAGIDDYLELGAEHLKINPPQ